MFIPQRRIIRYLRMKRIRYASNDTYVVVAYWKYIQNFGCKRILKYSEVICLRTAMKPINLESIMIVTILRPYGARFIFLGKIFYLQ
jgi:hypothetical protein